MEERHPPEPEPNHEEQIRAMGFDPGYLTPEEQVELLEIHSLWPDEALTV